jgi:hypothetical protein
LNKERKSWVEDNYSLFLEGDEKEPNHGITVSLTRMRLHSSPIMLIPAQLMENTC